MASGFLKRIHGETEEQMLLGRSIVQYVTEKLDIDISRLHVSFPEIFRRKFVLVLWLASKGRKKHGNHVIRHGHFARQYPFEQRLGKRKFMPSDIRTIFYLVSCPKQCESKFADFEKVALIRLENTLLQFHCSGVAKDALTTVAPPYHFDGSTVLRCDGITRHFDDRQKYEVSKETKKRHVCVELLKWGRCSFLDKGQRCQFAHPSYLADHEVPKPTVLVPRDPEGKFVHCKRIERRCPICTLPLCDDSEEKSCAKCATARPLRAFSKPQSYDKRAAAMFERFCVERDVFSTESS